MSGDGSPLETTEVERRGVETAAPPGAAATLAEHHDPAPDRVVDRAAVSSHIRLHCHPAVSEWLREKYAAAMEQATYRTFVLSITDRCNIRCDFCCHPYMSSDFDDASAERLVTEACALPFEEICVTGGEPFLKKLLLLRLARIARDRGVMFGTITNGFWARTASKAAAVAAELRDSGVARVTVSWDPSHGEFVDAATAQNAVDACMEAGLRVTLVGSFKKKGETHADHGIDVSKYLPYANFRLFCHAVAPAGNGASLELDDWEHPRSLAEIAADGARVLCPSQKIEEMVLYARDGLVQPCCSIYAGYKAPELSVGDWRAQSVHDLHVQWRGDAYYTLIRNAGFAGLYQLVAERDPELYRNLPRLEDFTNTCDLCAALMSAGSGAEVRRLIETVMLERALACVEQHGLALPDLGAERGRAAPEIDRPPAPHPADQLLQIRIHGRAPGPPTAQASELPSDGE